MNRAISQAHSFTEYCLHPVQFSLGWPDAFLLPVPTYSVEKLAIWLAAGSGGLAGSVILSPGEMEKWARKRP